MRHTARWGLDLWSVLVSIVLVGPLVWSAGLPVARDAVFAPSPPWTWQLAGLGGAAPRAVPVDALVTLGTHTVGAWLVARIALLVPLVLAGCAAHRLVAAHGPIARVLATSLAIVNPFTVERLALGQWALMWTWGAMWLYLLMWRRRRTRGGSGAALLGAAALGSITPTGGLLMLAAAVLTATAGHDRRRWWLPAGVLVLQAPWIVAGFVGGAANGIDPRGFEVFRMRGEVGWHEPWDQLVTMLSLGGLWDTNSVPGSREGLSVVIVSVVWVALAAAGMGTLRAADPGLLGRWVILSVGGLVVALLPAVPGGAELLGELGEVVPGLGLLRDSQKFILPFGVLWTLAAAVGAGRIARRVTDPGLVTLLTIVAAVAPWWAVPDGPATVHRTLAPVTYPDDFSRAAEVVAAGGEGELVTVPWRAYRVFDWATPSATYDPASRWFARPVVTQDRLAVDEVVLRGESPRAEELTPLLEGPTIDGASLGERGVRWVVTYLDDPAAKDLEVRGARLRYEGRYLRVHEIEDVAPPPAVSGKAAAVVASGAALAVLGSALAVSVRGRGRPARKPTHEA